jgi:hypothetical protein
MTDLNDDGFEDWPPSPRDPSAGDLERLKARFVVLRKAVADRERRSAELVEAQQDILVYLHGRLVEAAISHRTKRREGLRLSEQHLVAYDEAVCEAFDQHMSAFRVEAEKVLSQAQVDAVIGRAIASMRQKR